MRYPKVLMSIVVGLGLSLASCLGASLGWAEDHVASATTDPLGKVNRLPAALERTVGRLRTGLEAKGFAVARGYWTLWGVDDCKYPLETLGYCYGNNPTAPYVLAVVPTWKDEYVDPQFYHILNNPPRGMAANHRLDPREALVIVAELPPPARYFGIGSNVFTRQAAFNSDDPIIPYVSQDPLLEGILFGASPDPSRRMLIASIGNSTNNVVIERQTGQDPWNRPAYIVITSDDDMKAEMTDALVRAGASESDIFTEPVSPELVNLGLNRSADDLITYIRYSMLVDIVAGEKWRNELPLTILRVRDVSRRQYNNPLPVPIYTERTGNYNYDENQLAGEFTALQNAVRARWAQPQATLLSFFSAYQKLDLIGQHCLGYDDPYPEPRGPMDCLGDSQDADYQISLSGQLDNDKVIAVMGTLSTATGNATYTSLSVNSFPELVGVANIDDTDLKGTAAGFARALHHNSDLFYVYYVARDCTGLAHCLEISTELVPAGGLIKFIQRNYVNPGSTTGPDPNKVLNPVAIVFNGQNRPLMPFALGLAWLSMAPWALPQNVLSINKVPGRVESTAQQLTHSLEKQGFEVLRGYFKMYTNDDCDLSYQVMHTCYGNNPAAPYVIPIVPPWPDQPGPGEWVDPATIGALGKTADGFNATYRLDPREALVILAQMPPPAAFFSEKTYLFTRAGDLCTKSSHYDFIQNYMQPMFTTFFSLVPNEPGRVEIIADLTNNPNSVIMANQSGIVWDQLRYFVITPNPAMDAAIRQALVKVGIAGQYIFTEKIPGYFGSIPDDPSRDCPDAADVRFGLDPQADDFVTVLRYAMPVDDAAGDRWRQRLPLVVLRIRNLAAEEQTYAWEDFDPRTPSVPPETWYNDPPQNYLDKLTQAVCDSWNKPGTPQDCTRWHDFVNMQTPKLLLTGPACVPDWMNCIAPSEDSTYMMSGKLPLDPEHFYAVVGPLGTATDNATYVGLGSNMSKQQLGFANLSNEDLKDTATGYSDAVPSEKFFVTYFARDCKRLAGQLPAGVGFKCSSIGDQLPYCHDSADPDCNMLVLSVRDYIRPGTQRAADKDSMLKSKFIYLQIPKK